MSVPIKLKMEITLLLDRDRFNGNKLSRDQLQYTLATLIQDGIYGEWAFSGLVLECLVNSEVKV